MLTMLQSVETTFKNHTSKRLIIVDIYGNQYFTLWNVNYGLINWSKFGQELNVQNKLLIFSINWIGTFNWIELNWMLL